MKQPQPDTALLRHLMERAMRLENLPRTGQHPAVFIGIGITEHHLLPPAPGIEQSRILPVVPHAAADIDAALQALYGFE